MAERPTQTEGATSAAQQLVWTTDGQLHLLSIRGGSSAVEQCLGQPQIGDNLSVAFARAPELSTILDAHRKALQGERVIFSTPCKEKILRAIVQPLRNSDGQIVGCVGVAYPKSESLANTNTATDETTISRADTELPDDSTVFLSGRRAIEPYWRSVLDAAVDYVLILELDGRIRDVSRSQGILDRTRVIGRNILQLCPQEGREALQQKIQTVARTGLVVRHELEFVAATGRRMTYDVRIGPMRGNNQITALILVANDITERREVERQLSAEQALLRRLIDLQDRERRLIAYEIHDGLLQDVIGAQMLIQAAVEAVRKVDQRTVSHLEDAHVLLLKGIHEGRRLISELRPMVIDERGLVEAIEYLVKEEESHGDIHVNFRNRATFQRLAPLVEATLFRIVQEAVTNAKRHSQSDTIDIRLTQVDRRFVVLEIQDQGIGFDPDHIAGRHFGLESIRERARLFGGGATIESSPGHGTRITVKMPFEPFRPEDNPGNARFRWTV
jgi:PAS domain S-box-containing protein